MTTTTKLGACTLLIAVVLSVALLSSSRAYAQQSCTQVKMIFAEAHNKLYLIDGNGNPLVDIRNGNNLSNRQVDSYIVLWGTPSRIGIETEWGETSYRYRSNVKQPGDRGYEDYTDNDFNDAVILLTSVSCPEGLTRPRQVYQPPRGANPPPVEEANTAPSILSVSADNITNTTARAVVDIADHDDTQLTVKLRYQQKADVQDWTTDAETAEVTSSTSPATKILENLSPGTEYVLQASFDDTFPEDATKEHTFTTERQPSIQSVSVGNVEQTSARATVNIAGSDGSTQAVKLQYRTTSPQGQWSTPALEATSTGATAQIDLSGLTADTAYEVQAWLAEDETDKKTDTFRTLQGSQSGTRSLSPKVLSPSIRDVTFDNIAQTSADAIVNIRNAGTSQKTVRLHYRVEGTKKWSTVIAEKADASSVSISLTGLTAETTYEVQAWLDSSSPPSGTWIYSFDTLEEVPSISGLKFEDVGQTTATAKVEIEGADAKMKRVFLRYRVHGEDDWTLLPFSTITYGNEVSISLSGLKEQTTYDVAVALSIDFNAMLMKSLTTLPPVPVVSGVSIDDETQTAATANIDIANANGDSQTVHLRYRTTTPQGEWSDTQETTSTTDSAEIGLSGLSADTEYDVQASLDSSFPDERTAHTTFRTLRYPSISKLEVNDKTQTTANAVITIADPDGTNQTVHLRYRTTTPQGEWSDTQETTSTTDSAEIGLSGLTADTEYDVQASLDSSFPDERTAHTTFRTLRYPSISKLEVKDETRNSANAVITIADPDGTNQTVHLRYRTTTPQGEWSDTQKTTSTTGNAEIALSGLTQDTEYEAEASLTSDFGVSETDVFRTLPPAPVVSGVSVDDETQTAATANISIANANGDSQTVHLRYRIATPQGEWIDTQKATSTTDSAEIGLSGLSADTEYDVQASLDSSFSDERTAHTTFRTLRYPSISKLGVNDKTQTSANAVITIADPDGTNQTVHLRYRTTTPQGEWSDIQETTSTTGSAEIGLSGLTPDTEYESEASLTSDFGVSETVIFRTLRHPSISKLEVKDETRNSASAVITIADPDGTNQTVHLRYRTTTPQGEWSDTQKTTSTTGSAEIGLSGLIPDTEYEAEASLTSDFGVSETDVFRTLPPAPVVSGVSVDDETQTAATANISIANANGDSQTVHLRYRIATPQGEWSDTQKATSTTDSAEIGLSGLSADTEYDVQASLNSSFPDERTAHTTFRTLRTPSIESIEVVDIGRNGATVKAVVADSGGNPQTVYFRHRDKHYDLWRPTRQADSVDDVASTRLRGLISGTEYIVEVSLNDSFPADETESVTFTTKRRKEDASAEDAAERNDRCGDSGAIRIRPATCHFASCVDFQGS